MDDKELLELAALACGYDDAQYQFGGEWMDMRCGYPEAMWSEKLADERGSGYWNPLKDNSDAFHLMVKLNIQLTPPKHAGHGYVANDVTSFHVNPEIAVRRAITIAAARIGEKLRGE